MLHARINKQLVQFIIHCWNENIVIKKAPILLIRVVELSVQFFSYQHIKQLLPWLAREKKCDLNLSQAKLVELDSQVILQIIGITRKSCFSFKLPSNKSQAVHL